MNVVIVGCGRVGSELAVTLQAEGNDVTVIDVRPGAMARLGDFAGRMVVGSGIDVSLLRRAAVNEADAFIAVTPGDNRNIMAAQIARVIFRVPRVITRIKDPIREQVYRKLGLDTICSTTVGSRLIHDYVIPGGTQPTGAPPAVSTATLPAVPPSDGASAASERPYVLVIGGGMVGYHLTRRLLDRGHEVTLIEKDPAQVEWIEHQGELGTASVMVGDGDEMAFLATTGIERAGIVIAATGDDEDNLVVCQLAKEEFRVPRTIARVNNPVTVGVFTALGVDVPVSATELLMGLIEAELGGSDMVRGIAVKASGANLVDMALPELSAMVGRRVRDVPLPHGDLLVCIVREGRAIVPDPEVVIHKGDELIVYSHSLDVAALREFFAAPAAAVR